MNQEGDDGATLPVAEFRKELTAMVPQMRAFAQSLTGKPEAADDLTQEALMKAWKARDRFRAGTNFRAWVMTILRNQFYSDKRRAWRQADWDEEYAERTLTANDDPDMVLALDELRRAIHQLSDMHRDAIMLVGAGGFSYEEAAEICGCAVGTIKSRVNRARAALLEILEVGPNRKSLDDGVAATSALEELVTSVGAIADKPE